MRRAAASRRVVRRHVSSVVALVYAGVLAVGPVMHGTVEVLWSTASLEPEHSDTCPTLHGGAACHAAATVQVAHPSPPARLVSRTPSFSVSRAPSVAAPGHCRASSPPPARAPPRR